MLLLLLLLLHSAAATVVAISGAITIVAVPGVAVVAHQAPSGVVAAKVYEAGIMHDFVIVVVTAGVCVPDPLRLAGTIVNADMDTRDIEPSGVNTHEQGGGGNRLWAPHLPWPRAVPASSVLAGLKKPPLQSSRHWSPGHMARQGTGAKGHCKAMPAIESRRQAVMQ